LIKNKSSKKAKTHHNGKHAGNWLCHGKNCGHTTDECKAIQGTINQVKKGDKKVTFKKDHANKGKGDHKIKSCNKNPKEAEVNAGNELMAYIAKVVKKDLYSISQKKESPKCKQSDNSDNESFALAKSVNTLKALLSGNEEKRTDETDMSKPLKWATTMAVSTPSPLPGMMTTNLPPIDR
jgi:hypothetical protein